MSKSEKGYKLKYVLIPAVGLISAAAAVFICKRIRKNNF